MKRYVIKVATNIDMGSEHFVRSFLTTWFNHENTKLRPDRFGSGEPARRKVDEDGIEPAIVTWLDTGLTPVFKRVALPKFDCDIDWRRKVGIGRRGTILWKCTVRLDKAAGEELAIEFLRFLIQSLQPAFASIASEEEMVAKHKVKYPAYGGIAEKYVGLEVGEKLPGIYWLTYFGPWSIKRLGGIIKIRSVVCERLFSIDDGIAILAFPHCEDWAAESSRQIERAAESHLGRDLFFDKEKDFKVPS